MSSPPIPRGRWAAALALALAPFLALVWRFDFVCDDAYISFRYARNLARGLGLVFNPGVDPPVEGYSEFLWVVWISLAERLAWDPAVFARIASTASGVSLMWMLARHLLARFPDRSAAPMGALLFASTLPPLAVWSTGGMATMPFAWAVFACYDALFGDPERPRPVRAALFGILVVLLRADGAWWVAAVAGTGILSGWRGDRRALLRASMGTALVTLAVFAAHVAWRYATYGDLLPNTARVKLGFSVRALERGAHYLGLNLLTLPSLGLALLLALGARGEVRARRLGSAWMPLLATWLYAWIVGGDFMCFARFLVPSLPFLVLLLAAPLAKLEARLGPLAPSALVALLATLSLLPAFERHAVPESVRKHLQFRYNSPNFETEYSQWARMKGQAAEWTDLGKVLHQYAKPGDSLVYGAVGAVGYFSELFIYDQNGLVTREVALLPPAEGRRSPGHDKHVPAEFFKKYRPTFLDAFLYPPGRKLPPIPEQRGMQGPFKTGITHPRHGPLGLYVWTLPPAEPKRGAAGRGPRAGSGGPRKRRADK